MRRFTLQGTTPCVYYVSSRCRTWEPAKSLLIFAPDAVAADPAALDRFAEEAGWLRAAEEDGAVLILPISQTGWAGEKTALVKELYKTVWRDTISPDPRENLRNVWCWETLIFAVGYGEGAVFAGRAAAEQPNAFAQVAMIGGVPDRFDGLENTTDRWLLPDASPEWAPKNREIPVAVWFLGDMDTAEAEKAFSGRGSGNLVKVSRGTFGPDPETTKLLMAEFATRIRWKNSPDGTPARLKPKMAMDTDGEYIPAFLEHGGSRYDYYVRFPAGKQGAEGLPVVICMHGHGEPAWMFAQKNGWPELQDELGEFLFVSPDSPEHTWYVERDEGIQEKLVEALARDYRIDRTRIYLTGFSNGSMATCWYGTRHPRLFAALAPWNSPILSFEEKLLGEGWEMPMFAVNGDLDHKMDVPRRSYPILFENFIRLNGGTPSPKEDDPFGWACEKLLDGSNHYTAGQGYAQGHRLTTRVYACREGLPLFCYTQVKDMPHGAIHDEARATWSFFRQFSRPESSKTVIFSPTR